MGMMINFHYIAFHGLLASVLITCLTLADLSVWMFASMIGLFLILDLVYILRDVIYSLGPSTKEIEIAQRTFLVTGGSSGIGLSVSTCLSRRGGNVILVARNEERLRKAAEICRAARTVPSSKIEWMCIDLTGEASLIKEQVNKIEASFGCIDVLINCAGYSIPGEFCELSPEDFENMVATNYLGAVYITHAVVPRMKKRNFGQVVFLSSLAGQMSIYGYSAYSASKFALRGLAEALTHELTVNDIGITMVYPADTDTPGFSAENKRKPQLTKQISDDVGVLSAETVAELIVKGIENRSRTVVVGSDGFLLHALTCGAFLPSGLFEFLSQVLLMPLLRVYMLFLQSSYLKTIEKHREPDNRNS